MPVYPGAQCVTAGQVLEDLLTLARADSERASTNFLAVAIAPVVESVCKRLQSAADLKQLRMNVRVDKREEVFIWADATIIDRLLWILLDNAIKYTPELGSITVSMNCSEAHVTLAVEDDGIGIPAADIPHVFNRFYRTQTARETADGSGLGLAIAKWIADIHHAEITICGTRSVGTRIQVRFPIHTVEVELQVAG